VCCQTPSCSPHPFTTKRHRTLPASIQASVSERVPLSFSFSKIKPELTRAHLLTCYSSETVAALQTFRKRHSDAQRITGQLNAQPTSVDLAHYRSVLKNKGIVDEAEKILREFKPVTYDVGAHVKAIETFEIKAVRPLLFLSPFLRLLTLSTLFTRQCAMPPLDCQGEGDGSAD
jgi:hypothetical protein